MLSQSIRSGGVVVCPTEGVYGLSCDPRSPEAVERLIALKKRSLSKGLILVGQSLEQLSSYVDFERLTAADHLLFRQHWPGPVTFILPLQQGCSKLISGEHNSAAIRITAFPTLREICRQVGGPIISTSANFSGEEAVSEFAKLNQELLGRVDLCLQLPCGGLCEPTAIYDTLRQKLLRPSAHWNSLNQQEPL